MACDGLGFKHLDQLGYASSSDDDEEEEDAHVSVAAAASNRNPTTTAMRTVCDRAPYFVILGAQKAGTTALYSYIAQHPRVAPAVRKETHFLDWKWGIYAQCQLPNELEGPSFDAMAQSDWEWEQEPQHFAPLTAADFETPQIVPVSVPDADKSETGTAPPRQRKAAGPALPKLSASPISCDDMRQKYLLMFPFPLLLKNSSLVCGEASPSYALYGQVPARLHRLNPK